MVIITFNADANQIEIVEGANINQIETIEEQKVDTHKLSTLICSVSPVFSCFHCLFITSLFPIATTKKTEKKAEVERQTEEAAKDKAEAEEEKEDLDNQDDGSKRSFLFFLN